jgi:hypothetical protein
MGEDRMTKDQVNVGTGEVRPVAEAVVKKAAAELYNLEYGLKPGRDKGAYTPETVTDDEVPLTMDLVTFVMWLRHNSDFFSGPDLNQHHPKFDDPQFAEVLADLALDYTGE